jgi:hypothetical protein
MGAAALEGGEPVVTSPTLVAVVVIVVRLLTDLPPIATEP